MSRLLALAGFVSLALSPSFVDWQQSPDLRPQIVIYYVVAGLMVYLGLDGWIRSEK